MTEEKLMSTSSVHDISDDLTNEEIQTVFDNANSGDTVKFIDKKYSNFSIVVDKKLNIVSDVKSELDTQSAVTEKAREMGVGNSFGFYLTDNASGTLIKGLTFVGNADYAIMLEGADDVKIKGNTISGSKKAGIYLADSQYDSIENNVIRNSYDGLYLSNTNRSIIRSNKISSNRHDGLTITDCVLNNVTYNDVRKNGHSGLLLKNAKVNRFSYNNFTDNSAIGIQMEGYTTRNIIKCNNLSGNVINLYLNSLTNNDEVSQNTIMYAKQGSIPDTDYGNSGSGIFFADNYGSAAYSTLSFSRNSIGANQGWDAKSLPSHPAADIGSNWYFDNKGNYAIGRICPNVFGTALFPDELGKLTIGFSKSGDGVTGQLYEGGKGTGAGEFTVDNVNIDGKDYGSATVSYDGKLTIKGADIREDSIVTFTFGGETVTVKASGDGLKESEENQKPQSSQGSGESYKPTESTGGSGAIGNGTSTGSGSGDINGSGSGNSHLNGSGIMAGATSSLGSNGGTGDSGENGAGSASASQSAKSYEISKQVTSGASAQNRQFIAIVAISFVMLLILAGYRRKKNNNEEFGELDDYSF